MQVTTLCYLAVKMRAAGDRSFNTQVAVMLAAAQEDELKNHGTVLNLGSSSSWIKLKGKREKHNKRTGMKMAFCHFLGTNSHCIITIS